MQLNYNICARTKKIEYIVVHDTANVNKGADAKAHFAYFNGGNRNSSADFFVDDTNALQVNDYRKYYTWHCGDGKGKNGITNQNSVGVEICVNQDGDYRQAIKNAARLVRRLMAELHIPAHRVVRHYDASGKICPASMLKNNWAAWQAFQKDISISDRERVQQAVGLADETMDYLEQYTYGKDLLQKLAQAV